MIMSAPSMLPFGEKPKPTQPALATQYRKARNECQHLCNGSERKCTGSERELAMKENLCFNSIVYMSLQTMTVHWRIEGGGNDVRKPKKSLGCENTLGNSILKKNDMTTTNAISRCRVNTGVGILAKYMPATTIATMLFYLRWRSTSRNYGILFRIVWHR